MVHNKKEITKTGGGQAKLLSFSAAEETLIRIVDMESSIGLPGTVAFGGSTTSPCLENEQDEEMAQSSDALDACSSSFNAAVSPLTEAEAPSFNGPMRASTQICRGGITTVAVSTYSNKYLNPHLFKRNCLTNL